MPGKKLKFNVMNASEDKSRGNRITNREGNVLMKESEPLKSRKRRLEMAVVGQRAKRQKLDCFLRLQLRKILKELINHQAGWIFSEPVDPVKLKIPDYVSIITKPMDLGTVLRKLEGNMYSGADEVEADVRLTFSNAMIYNPQWHEVHRSAKTLNAIFSRKLVSLEEAKSKHSKKKDDFMGKNGQMKPNDLKKAPLSLEEKQKFRLELVQSSQMIEKLRTVFQKFGLVGLDEEKLDAYIDSTDDETLLKLRREFKAVLSAKDGKVEPGKIGLKCCSTLNKAVEKEIDKIDAQIKATRKRERDAARIALEKLEKSVEFDGNVGVLEALKRIGCSYLYYPPEAIHHGNRLQQPDLFCKIDSLKDNEDTH